MPELLIELFSEEIPARMQAQAARDLERLIKEKLTAAGFGDVALQAYAGPRRLTVVANDLPAAQADRSEEVKGPRVGAPPQAMEGFLKKVGLTESDLIERDGVYYANLSSVGRPTAEIIAEAVEHAVRSFPWPKSMKWGSCALRWVRPLKRIVVLFGGAVVPVEIEGIKSGDITEGHRFMGDGKPFKVADFAGYRAGLESHFVVLDSSERKRCILNGARAACAARGFELVEDDGLLDEVAGLAEWPVPMLGDMDPSFLDLPPEVIRTSMRTHQKYFAVRDPNTGGLAPHFVVVANLEASDGGAAIAAGNARVLSARLNDARFFWDEDNRPGNLEAWLEKLNEVTYHGELGSVRDRLFPMINIARRLAALTGADERTVAQAARYSKVDLVSQMVGEFPELQGLMGGYYIRGKLGALPGAPTAISDHYKPVGPNDRIPATTEACCVALADKLNVLTGFWYIDEKPSGSRDPFALRRAALGVVRIIVERQFRLNLLQIIDSALEELMRGEEALGKPLEESLRVDLLLDGLIPNEEREAFARKASTQALAKLRSTTTSSVRKLDITFSLLSFLADRLKVALRDQGKRHDLVDAVFALGDDDLVRVVARVEALSGFLATDDGANLLAGYKRAANILRAEEKKGTLPTGEATALAGASHEEGALIAALTAASSKVDAALEAEDFVGAMTALASLRVPVDAFFDKVLVNSDVPEERANRLKLLSQVKDLMGRVADFSQISG